MASHNGSGGRFSQRQFAAELQRASVKKLQQELAQLVEQRESGKWTIGWLDKVYEDGFRAELQRRGIAA